MGIAECHRLWSATPSHECVWIAVWLVIVYLILWALFDGHFPVAVLSKWRFLKGRYNSVWFNVEKKTEFALPQPHNGSFFRRSDLSSNVNEVIVPSGFTYMEDLVFYQKFYPTGFASSWMSSFTLPPRKEPGFPASWAHSPAQYTCKWVGNPNRLPLYLHDDVHPLGCHYKWNCGCISIRTARMISIWRTAASNGPPNHTRISL